MNKIRVSISSANMLYFVVCILAVFVGIPTSILLNISYGQEAYAERVFILINQVMFVLFPLLVYLAYKSEKINIKSVLRLNPISSFTILLVVLISICIHYVLSFLNIFVTYLFNFIGDIPNIGITPAENIFELIVSIFVFAFIPSVCEELLHRGIMLNAYERRGTIKAIVISSLLFGIFHYDLRAFVSPVIFGIILGYVVIKTDSIFAGIIAHFVNNALSEVIQFFGSGYFDGSNNIIMEQVLISIPTVILAIIVLFISLKLLSNSSKSEYVAPISGLKNDVVSVLSHWPIVLSIVMYVSITAMFIVTQTQ